MRAWRVDPDLRGQHRWLWGVVDETFGMCRIREIEGLLPALSDLASALHMDHLRSQQPKAGMMVLGVVRGKELLTKTPRILQRAETLRELRAVVQRLELPLGKRIVVRNVRPGMSLGHAEIGQQEGHGLRGHRRSSIRVDVELSRNDLLLFAGRRDELACQVVCVAVG